LDTGDAVRTLRHDVEEGVLDTVRRHLQRALHLGIDPIRRTDHQLFARAEHSLLAGTILSPSGRPLVTFGVAPEEMEAPRLWEMLIDDPNEDCPAQRPDAPWAALRIEDPVRSSAIAEWADDYERAVAWAWTDMQIGY
jgi:hypothetical protein